MNPDMWYVELALGGSKVHAGCNGKLVWRHTPWLGAHAAKGPVRPLRRALQVKLPALYPFLVLTQEQLQGMFGETAMSHTKTRMEEAWTIEEVAFNVPGLSVDCFIPPSELRFASMSEACELPQGQRVK
ncbi:hypothetical protein SESBI_51157 [Sesbania bispinosa]|nr:hypothetical protein SESBI_51157 [Sesbania bispinosa]